MSRDTPRRRIKATVTLEGDAEAVLADVQRVRANKRRVSLMVGLPAPGHSITREDYVLPEIKGGDTQGALEYLAKLSRQARLDHETDQRLARLIEEFGRFTE